MKILNLLNPTSWIGKIGIWAALFFGGMYFGAKFVDPCPPATQVNVDQKFKVGKIKDGSSMSSSLNGMIQPDCNEWLKSLSMREIKSLRK